MDSISRASATTILGMAANTTIDATATTPTIAGTRATNLIFHILRFHLLHGIIRPLRKNRIVGAQFVEEAQGVLGLRQNISVVLSSLVFEDPFQSRMTDLQRLQDRVLYSLAPEDFSAHS